MISEEKAAKRFIVDPRILGRRVSSGYSPAISKYSVKTRNNVLFPYQLLNEEQPQLVMTPPTYAALLFWMRRDANRFNDRTTEDYLSSGPIDGLIHIWRSQKTSAPTKMAHTERLYQNMLEKGMTMTGMIQSISNMRSMSSNNWFCPSKNPLKTLANFTSRYTFDIADLRMVEEGVDISKYGFPSNDLAVQYFEREMGRRNPDKKMLNHVNAANVGFLVGLNQLSPGNSHYAYLTEDLDVTAVMNSFRSQNLSDLGKLSIQLTI